MIDYAKQIATTETEQTKLSKSPKANVEDILRDYNISVEDWDYKHNKPYPIVDLPMYKILDDQTKTYIPTSKVDEFDNEIESWTLEEVKDYAETKLENWLHEDGQEYYQDNLEKLAKLRRAKDFETIAEALGDFEYSVELWNCLAEGD